MAYTAAVIQGDGQNASEKATHPGHTDPVRLSPLGRDPPGAVGD